MTASDRPTDPLARPSSPELLAAEDAALIVVDVQEKLLPTVPTGPTIAWNIGRLARAAALFEVPVRVTEQYPRGLGPTVRAVADLLPGGDAVPAWRHEKTAFSLLACGPLLEELIALGRRRVVLAGIETAVCVLQSALDLVAQGFDVTVVVDAVGSRSELDHRVALRRLELAGIRLVTTEMVLFEWCRDSRHVHFKTLSGLVRESPPPPV